MLGKPLSRGFFIHKTFNPFYDYNNLIYCIFAVIGCTEFKIQLGKTIKKLSTYR